MRIGRADAGSETSKFSRIGDQSHRIVLLVEGEEVTLTLVFGPAMLGLSLLLVIVGWARSELRKRTLAQVIAGSGLGAVVAAVIVELFR